MKRLLCLLPLISFAHAADLEMKTSTGSLHGTLEEPPKADKSLVVLIHPGSGPTDRDGNSLGLPGKNNSLKLLATGLAEKGIPSLRIDKRGIGASKAAGPKEENLRFDTYIDDTTAWIDHLQTTLGYQKVVILGHSEGALIGLIAAKKKSAAAYISLAGTSKRAGPLLRDQLKTKLPAPLLGEATVILQQLDQGVIVKKVSPELNTLFRTSVQPYLISWFKYTPKEEITGFPGPVLIVQGSTDIQVSPADAEALHEAKPASSIVIVDGMNHVLKAVGPDLAEQAASYSDPKLPLHPALLPAIETFVRETSGKEKP